MSHRFSPFPPSLPFFFSPMEALMKARLTLLCSSDNQELLIPSPLLSDDDIAGRHQYAVYVILEITKDIVC